MQARYALIFLLSLVTVALFSFYVGARSARAKTREGTTVEVKAWIDLDGKRGVQAVPEISINGNHYNWVHAPFSLDNRHDYTLTAPPTLFGFCWLFWQRESDGYITPTRTIQLKAGFEEETWWQNYGKCSP